MKFIKDMTNDLTDNLDIPYRYALNIAEVNLYQIQKNNLTYHNEFHVLKTVECYKKHFIDNVDEDPKNLGIIAIWFHDSVYIPNAKSGVNEYSSAIFASSLLNNWLDTSSINILKDFILFTNPTTSRFHLFNIEKQIRDCDIHGFSLPSYSYIQNSINIRKEYDCTNQEWYNGRMQFLSTVLNRTRIYATPEFQQYEEVARYNLQAELAYIKKRSAEIFDAR